MDGEYIFLVQRDETVSPCLIPFFSLPHTLFQSFVHQGTLRGRIQAYVDVGVLCVIQSTGHGFGWVLEGLFFDHSVTRGIKTVALKSAA